MRPFTDADLAPLTAPITTAELRAFRRAQLEAARGGPHARARRKQLTFAWTCAGIIVALAFGAAIRITLDPDAAASVGGSDHAGTIAVVIAIGVPVLALAAAVALYAASIRAWTHRFRLDAFARTNGFGLVFASGTPAYPGALFRGAPDAAAYDRLHAQTGRALELGGYRYTMRLDRAPGRRGMGVGGFGRTMNFDAKSTRRDWGYLALRLDAPVPQIMLEARAHRGALSSTGHPAAYRGNPMLTLPGDRRRVFTLYCPSGSEKAALRMFRPELLALLADAEHTLDVELVDDWMFVYSPDRWDLTDPTLVRRLLQIAETALGGMVPNPADDRGAVEGSEAAGPRGMRPADWPAERPNEDDLPPLGRYSTVVGVAVLAAAAAIAVWLVASLAVTGAGAPS